MKTLIGSAFLLLLGAALAQKSYSGYQVVQTAPLNDSTLKLMKPFLKNSKYDFWAWPRLGKSADIMVAPENVEELKNALQNLGLEPSVLIPDLGVVVKREREEMEAIRATENLRSGRAVTFERFMEYDEIQQYLDEVVAAYPDLASIEEIGNSYEGRPLRLLKISNGPGKKALFMDAAIHAREWITPPVALYAIYQLLENYDENKALVDLVDWYILPVANPDGYSFSFTNDRFWRKTRRPNPGSSCVGTDPNRNFDFHYGEEGENDPCGQTFPGTGPFSESECQAMGSKLYNTTEITLYIALHSYGELLMYPYGHTTELPPTVDELNANAEEAALALESVRGTVYEIGSVANILYYSYGACRDWSYGVAGIPLSYTFELPYGGSGGFNPPASAIVPVNTETWEAIKVLASKAAAATRP